MTVSAAAWKDMQPSLKAIHLPRLRRVAAQAIQRVSSLARRDISAVCKRIKGGQNTKKNLIRNKAVLI